MPAHSEDRFLPYTPKQVFDLIADIESYPKFLPWIAAARIRSRQPIDAGEEIHADLVISFKVFRERFGSRVKLFPEKGLIQTDYLDGPFKYLHSYWQIEEAPEGCRVQFSVDFEFRNAILQRVIGLVFYEALQRVVRAFEQRAEALFGDNAKG